MKRTEIKRKKREVEDKRRKEEGRSGEGKGVKWKETERKKGRK